MLKVNKGTAPSPQKTQEKSLDGPANMGAEPQETQYYVGIRREDKNKWERRVSITPKQVRLVRNACPNIHFIVEPSKLRIYSEKEYRKAGAVISEDLSKCSTIVGVKAVPIKKMMPNKTYMYFAHVIKA